MKTESLERLMDKYREGTLSDEERDELNRLTHRDTVMAAASQRARGIQHRTRLGIGFTVLVLVAGGAVWTLMPRTDKAPQMAEVVTPMEVTVPEPVVEQQAVPEVQPQRQHVQKKSARPLTAAPQRADEDEPVVICNNQCEADSVISDIWKFLTV
ncbi:MAG: hypothetical protein J6V98_06430 [Bacteroidales bacterium]|nr:hypothetical protein [Bacteroidales bacterium]